MTLIKFQVKDTTEQTGPKLTDTLSTSVDVESVANVHLLEGLTSSSQAAAEAQANVDDDAEYDSEG